MYVAHYRIMLFGVLLIGLSQVQAAENADTAYNRVSFSEQADVEVENDTLVAMMYAQKEGKRADQLANEVNQIIRRALDRLKQTPEIKVQTLLMVK